MLPLNRYSGPRPVKMAHYRNYKQPCLSIKTEAPGSLTQPNHPSHCTALKECPVLQQAIEQVLSTMPESTRVGIITFGSMVYLHNLMAANIATSAVFRGTKETTKNDVAGLVRRGGAMQSPFLAPLGTCSFAMDAVLEGLTPEANSPVRLLPSSDCSVLFSVRTWRCGCFSFISLPRSPVRSASMAMP